MDKKEQLVEFKTSNMLMLAGIGSDWCSNMAEINDEKYPILSQSMAQRWLREIHRIIVHVSPVYSNYSFGGSKLDGFSYHINGRTDYHEYDTYEKALEEGLQEAIKLIVIKQ